MSNGNIPPEFALNRANEIKRDTDSQKSVSISLYDIDETIFNHLNKNLKLEVVDGGVIKKVTVMYGSPELWKAMKTDAFIRDYQGKITLPCIIIKRTSSESDEQLAHFNRYLNETVIRTHSPKNKYTKFSVLHGSNVPVNEVYNITFPSHMKLTYHMVIWTEKVEQMNKLVESFQFNTKDYWGNKDGYKFRVDAPSFAHTVELQADDDRLVKTEFDLNVHGYILPETITKLDSQQSTFKKQFTPKKIIMGIDVVSSDYNFDAANHNKKKWKNQLYPNKDYDEVIPTAPITVVDGTSNISIINSIVSTLNSRVKVSGNSTQQSTISSGDYDPFLKIVQTPQSITSSGQEGDVSFDDDYFYIYTNNQWRRVAISNFS